jgi:predicted DNA-binding transcriptional regulator YafY
MAKKLAYERYLWFHSRVKAGRYPNAADVARHFEVSEKTAHRDIRFIAERLQAPLEYDTRKKGYYYSEDGFELPGVWLQRDEVVALVLARRLAATIPDRRIKDQLKRFLEKVSSYLPSGSSGAGFEKLGRKISIKNIEYFGVDEVLFNRILEALLLESTIEIRYYSPYKDEETARRIVPLHLLNYMGNWHLVAYCTRSRALRDFALSRIKQLRVSATKVKPPTGLPGIKKYMEKYFGIFIGGSSIEVTLRFSPQVSRWVREQIWHPEQKSRLDGRGRLVLSVPVTDFREIKREILKFGGDVEVLKPAALRRQVIEEIDRMREAYAKRQDGVRTAR